MLLYCDVGILADVKPPLEIVKGCVAAYWIVLKSKKDVTNIIFIYLLAPGAAIRVTSAPFNARSCAAVTVIVVSI